MKINLHARKIDIKFRAAIYAMGEFAMFRLVPSTRLRNNITLNIHLKHHVVDGEAKLSEFTNPKKPREFKIIIDPYRAEVDDFNRTLTILNGVMQFSNFLLTNWFMLNNM